MKQAQIDVKRRSLKAIFKLRQSLQGINVRPQLALKLFDKLIKPIATYGCEIWGNSPILLNKSKQKFPLWHFMENLPVEKVHIRFCKYVLGLHAKASNNATLGELGRCPIGVDISLAIIKYFQRLSVQPQDNVLLQSAANEATHLASKGKKSWMSLASVIHRQHTTDVHNTASKLTRTDCRKIKQSLERDYSHKWLHEVQLAPEGEGTGKLSTYRQIKMNLSYENYLNDVLIKDHRVAITKLRTSCHHLAIETGRYTQPITPREKRTCNKCHILEDEYHVLICCKKYERERETMSKEISLVCQNFSNLNSRNKFLYLMTAEGPVAIALGKFCSNLNL